MLGISPFTIRRYIQLRKLKAVKLEGSYRVRQGDLEQFLKAREIETEEELEQEEQAAKAKGGSERRAAPLKKTARPSIKSETRPKRTPSRVQTRAERRRSRTLASRDGKEQ